MNTVFSAGHFRDVHEVDVSTNKGRVFRIDIYKNETGYDSEVTILDSVSDPKVSQFSSTNPTSPSAIDNFRAGVELVEKYLLEIDPNDTINDFNNPCNCPFISEDDQNITLKHLGYSNFKVRVNGR